MCFALGKYRGFPSEQSPKDRSPHEFRSLCEWSTFKFFPLRLVKLHSEIKMKENAQLKWHFVCNLTHWKGNSVQHSVYLKHYFQRGRPTACSLPMLKLWIVMIIIENRVTESGCFENPAMLFNAPSLYIWSSILWAALVSDGNSRELL